MRWPTSSANRNPVQTIKTDWFMIGSNQGGANLPILNYKMSVGFGAKSEEI